MYSAIHIICADGTIEATLRGVQFKMFLRHVYTGDQLAPFLDPHISSFVPATSAKKERRFSWEADPSRLPRR